MKSWQGLLWVYHQAGSMRVGGNPGQDSKRSKPSGAQAILALFISWNLFYLVGIAISYRDCDIPGWDSNPSLGLAQIHFNLP